MAETGPEIDIAALQQLRADGAPHVVVDVRAGWERDICAIADSISIPLDQLPERAGELPAEGPIVLLCHHGMRSLNAALWLRSRGNDRAVSLSGGIDAWADEVDPAMRRY